VIRVSDLTIDTRRRVVQRGARDIELTAKEFDFLVCLARNAGRVVSRSELLAEVWDDSEPTHSNVIDVYASRLRRKIDQGEGRALVTTLRGVGYIIDLPQDGLPVGRARDLQMERG
jgi:DNA-binding response OmpR family regulator